jgi:hypothetical protein
MAFGQGRDIGEIADAPCQVLASQLRVEGLIARGGVPPVDLVGAIEIESKRCFERTFF